MSDNEMTLEQIQETRVIGRVLADMEHEMLGEARKYILIAYELFPNGASSDPITDPDVAREIGRRTGLGDPPDPAGFAIWPVPDAASPQEDL